MSKLSTTIVIILVLIAISYIAASFFGQENVTGNVALIKITGDIVAEDSGGLLSGSNAVSSDIVGFINDANSNPQIKAILLEIDSPGGSAVASAEIADAVKSSNKTTVAWIREIGTSGAYWIASSADKIVAHPLSITGSIGVIGSYLDFAQLLERYNVTYERLVSGKYKDIGSPYKELTPDEEQVLQDAIQKIHVYFVDSVARNRNLSVDYVSKIATGQFYIGEDAKNMSLVDELGGEREAEGIIMNETNLTSVELVEYKKTATIWDRLSQVFSKQSFSIGEGMGYSLLNGQTTNKVQINT